MSIPSIATHGKRRPIVSTMNVWRKINTHVVIHGSLLPPVHIFRHGLQVLYSKTKFLVDGFQQFHTGLRSPMS